MRDIAGEIERGMRHLRKADPILREVIQRAGPFQLKLRHDRFHALVFSILAQQISGSAARSIRKKLEASLEPEGITAEQIRALRVEDLRKVGLSRQKATYILDLAQRVHCGELQLNRMGRLSDESVIEALVKVKGIGVWTAQMFLIFSLGRLDVFPHTDLGIRTAIQRLYGLDDLPDREVSHRIAGPWRPYASIASWYCWRSLEG
jgi:DNA-3-methyladenine glycosylase II